MVEVTVAQADIELTVSALRAWADHIAGGYSCPAASQTMFVAAAHLEAFASHHASTAPDAEPVADRPVTSNPVDDSGSGNTSDKPVAQAVVEALRPFARLADEVEQVAAACGSTPNNVVKACQWEDLLAVRAALAAMGERS